MNTRRGFFGMVGAGLAALFCRQEEAPSLRHPFHSRNWVAGAWPEPSGEDLHFWSPLIVQGDSVNLWHPRAEHPPTPEHPQP